MRPMTTLAPPVPARREPTAGGARRDPLGARPGHGLGALPRRLARVPERRALLAPSSAARPDGSVAWARRLPPRSGPTSLAPRAAPAPSGEARPYGRAGRRHPRRARALARGLRSRARQPARAHRATPHARAAAALARAAERATRRRTPRAGLGRGSTHSRPGHTECPAPGTPWRRRRIATMRTHVMSTLVAALALSPLTAGAEPPQADGVAATDHAIAVTAHPAAE